MWCPALSPSALRSGSQHPAQNTLQRRSATRRRELGAEKHEEVMWRWAAHLTSPPSPPCDRESTRRRQREREHTRRSEAAERAAHQNPRSCRTAALPRAEPSPEMLLPCTRHVVAFLRSAHAARQQPSELPSRRILGAPLVIERQIQRPGAGLVFTAAAAEDAAEHKILCTFVFAAQRTDLTVPLTRPRTRPSQRLGLTLRSRSISISIHERT